MRFSGHESFACRYAWLPKAFRAIVQDPAAFRDEEQAMVSLGVGKNMVRSIRFWLAALLEAVTHPTDADGLVVVTLCESPDEYRAATATAAAVEVASRPEVIVAVPPPLQGIAAEVQDTRCWQWVAHNTPELAQDAYAAAEIARQVATSRRVLLRRLTALFGFHGENTDAVQWWCGGRRFDLPARGGLSAALSTICDNRECRVYPAPLGIEPRQRR